MKYFLDNRFVLRGWKDKIYSIIDLETNDVEDLTEIDFQTLSFCVNGIDFNSCFILSPHKNSLKKFIKNKVVSCYENNKNLNKEQKYKFYNCNFIKHVHWSITGNCNLNCRHCYMSANKKNRKDLTIDSCSSIIKQMAECGINSVSLTGGEPFVRDDFWEIVDILLNNKIRILSIYTNGFNINEDILYEFEKRKIKPSFSLSFDGIGYHDWLRGVKGAEEKTIKALKILNENGYETSCEFCIYKDNSQILDQSIKFLEKIGVSFVKVNKVTNIGNWSKNNCKNSISTKEVYDIFLEYILKFLKNNLNISIQLMGFFYFNNLLKKIEIPAIKNEFNKFICEHSKNVMYINYKGEAFPCVSLDCADYVYKSKIKNNLNNILNNSLYLYASNLSVEDFMNNNSRCKTCSYKNMCAGGCRANAYIKNKDLFSCDDDMCIFFKEGYYEKIKKKLISMCDFIDSSSQNINNLVKV